MTDFSIAPSIKMQVFSAVADIDMELWKSAQKNMQFYQSQDFLRIIEDLHSDIKMRYALVFENEKLLGIVYTQQMLFSYQHIVNYSSPSSNRTVNAMKKYVAGKSVYLLNAGNVFFTGDKGIVSDNEEKILPLLPDIMHYINLTFAENKCGAFLMANINLSDESKCIFYKSKKYHPFTTEPDMYMFVNSEWNTFEDYLHALTSKYRTRAKKVLSVSESIQCRILNRHELSHYAIEINLLYKNVMEKTDFNLARLNPDFFQKVALQYSVNCTIKGYFLNENLVAFVCLFACNDKQLHVHYIGLDYEVNAEYKLYNRMLFEFVRFAIENKFEKIHFGRTATEIKSTIGAQAMPLHAYLKMKNRLLNLMLPKILQRIKPQPYILRNPFR